MPKTTKTIAIVDDDVLVRSGLRSLIRCLGYTAETFEDGHALLEKDLVQYDCVITDMKMPSMSGEDLQLALGVSCPSLPVVFMTANTDERTRLRALKAGARGFLDKPGDMDQLVNLLGALLETVPA